MNRFFSPVGRGITLCYLLLALLYFSPLSVPYKGAFPLVFLALCSLRYSSRAMMMAMLFSALGDVMGICHNFWGQMGAFAVAHVAFIVYFCRLSREGAILNGVGWKWATVLLYGLLAAVFIVPHVQGFLRLGVMGYIVLILSVCGLAWMQPNPFYAVGAWLFVLSDTVLAWNKFVSPIGHVGYFIMVPYYLGQWFLFMQSIQKGRPNRNTGYMDCTDEERV